MKTCIRFLLAAGVFALSFGGVAHAETRAVAIGPLTLSPEMQKKFETEYGLREVDELNDHLDRAVARALQHRGVSVADDAPVRLEVTLVQAKPSKPTREQLLDRPGLDYFASVSLGGAELEGRFVDGDGRVLGEPEGEYFEPSLTMAPVGAWEHARRAIQRFAQNAAQTYAAVE